MTAPTLVETVFRDMAGTLHDTSAAARQASICGLLAASLIDSGILAISQRTADAIASALMTEFDITPKDIES